MTWIVQRVCQREESIYLSKADSGIVRQISVPGAEEAWMKGDRLIIRAKTGYWWEVEPDTGARRRILAQNSESPCNITGLT